MCLYETVFKDPGRAAPEAQGTALNECELNTAPSPTVAGPQKLKGARSHRGSSSSAPSAHGAEPYGGRATKNSKMQSSTRGQPWTSPGVSLKGATGNLKHPPVSFSVLNGAVRMTGRRDDGRIEDASLTHATKPSIGTGSVAGAGTMPFLPRTRRSQAREVAPFILQSVPGNRSSKPKRVERGSPPPNSGLIYSPNGGFKLSTLHLRRACGGRLRLGADSQPRKH